MGVVRKTQPADEQRHGEPNPGKAGKPVNMRPCRPDWQLHDAQFDQRPGKAEHPELLAQHQAGGNAKWQGGQQVVQTQTSQRYTGIGKGENRYDQEQDVRRQRMLDGVQRRFAVLVLERDEKRCDHPGQRGMHAGFQHQHPNCQTQQQSRGHPVGAAHVLPRHAGDRQQGHAQMTKAKVGCVKQRDDNDCAYIIQNGKGQQEHFQAGGNPVAKQCQNTQSKGDICRSGNRPALQVRWFVPVERHKYERRNRHAAHGSYSGQNNVARVFQFTFKNLALQLKPDQEKENCHQAVIDPQDQRLGDALTIDCDGKRRVQQIGVGLKQRGICHQHRCDSGQDQKNTTRGLVKEKTVYRALQHPASCKWPKGFTGNGAWWRSFNRDPDGFSRFPWILRKKFNTKLVSVASDVGTT